SSRHHCYLHSFPTRRSSDLLSQPISNFYLFLPANRQLPLTIRRFPTTLNLSISRFSSDNSRESCYHVFRWIEEAMRHTRRFKLRSEEHTSELQSRENLVCRL